MQTACAAQVTISASLAAKLSPPTRATLEEAGGSFVISGLAYALPPAGSGGLMHFDDKLKNGIFSSACKKAWAAAVSDCSKALDAEAGPMSTAGPARCALSHARGVSALHGMVKALESKTAASKKAKEEERIAEGRRYHASWLERKNASMIRLPDRSAFDDGPPSAPPSHFAKDGPPRMICSGRPGSSNGRVAPKPYIPRLRSSVEILEGMGSRILKVAHAIGEGNSKDLQSSRAYLLNKGQLFLGNFANPEDGTITEESRAAFAAAQAESVLVKAAAEKARKRAADEAAFADWCTTKEGTQLARDCMDLMPCTLGRDKGEAEAEAAAQAQQVAAAAAAASVDTGLPHAAATGRREAAGAATAGAAGPLRAPTEDECALWHSVGYACRCINRVLLEEWSAWSAPLFTHAQCWALWKSFQPPPGSEPHASGGSGGDADLSSWGPPCRIAALRLLHTLTEEHKRLALFRIAAAGEAPPVLPMFRRCADAEELPRFLHGSEGAVARVGCDLGIPDGNGCQSLGGSGVGAELVLQWWVGEEAHPAHGAGVRGGGAVSAKPTPAVSAASPEGAEELVGRMQRASRAAAKQPPYVIVLESVGVSGGPRSREGGWQRVLVDPPTPLPLLTSAPGSSYVPLSPLHQGLCVLPPEAGVEWDSPPTRLRGAIRIVGLKPNTCYAFRIRAYSRVGAGPYAFGAFTTAPSPPPAPIPALPTYVPPGILASEGAQGIVGASFPVQADSLALIWDRGVDFRVGLLRLLRLFAVAAGEQGTWRSSSPRAPKLDADGILDYGDEGEGPPAQGLFEEATTAPRSALLGAIKAEEGMRLWLRSCCAAADFWVIKEGVSGAGRPLYVALAEAEMEGGGEGLRGKVPASMRTALARPVDVLEALVRDIRDNLTWAEVCALFSLDGDGRSASDLLLAGLELPPRPPPWMPPCPPLLQTP